MSQPLEKAVTIIIQVVDPDMIILFGSHASGDDTVDSDYDLLVLKKNVENSRKLVQEIYLNFRNIGAPMDVIVTDLEKYQQLKKDPYMIYYDVARNGKVVYERH